MRIGMLGTGKVGQALGNGFLGLGHEVKMGSRDAQHAGMLKWVTRSGPRASGGMFAEAAAFGGLIVLATRGITNEQCLTQAGLENFRDKVVIDDAKETVAGICREFGWGVVDLGGIESSRYLEAMCMAWVVYGARSGTWNHAFKLLRR